MYAFVCRPVVFKDIPEFKYQATLLWPQGSKKPSVPNPLKPDELNAVMIRFALSISTSRAPKYNSHSWATTKSSSPTPSQASSNTSSKISGNGPPGFAQISGGFVNSMLSSTPGSTGDGAKPRFDYDVPLESLLDGATDDIDHEAEILLWIKEFLQNELGRLGGNVPMPLVNNIRSLGSDEIVLQEIVNFAKSKQIPMDSAKRDSIANGLRMLRLRIRSREDVDLNSSGVDGASSSASFQFPACLANFTDQDLEFVYEMPLNHEYLDLLDKFYAKFLKHENLEFRMDFDQAFKKLSPFMAFKSFSWILDWMTNDRRKRLRQSSDLKDFDDSEEILGAVEQFWNNLKRMKAKNMFSYFFNEDKDKVNKMLICYMKHHILDLSRMNNIARILKETKPDEAVDRYLSLPDMNIDFGKSNQAQNLDYKGLKKTFDRFYAWLNNRPFLNFIREPGAKTNLDMEFQKISLLYTWSSSNKSIKQLEKDLKNSSSLKSLMDKWKQLVLQNFSANLDVDAGALIKLTLDFLADDLDMSKTAVDFAASLAENQGFVAHHYNSDIAVILTIKGEVVIFEKSVVFIQHQQSWSKVNTVDEIKVGTYVRLRGHPNYSNVATKVWACNDFRTKEPFSASSSIVKGNANWVLLELAVLYICLKFQEKSITTLWLKTSTSWLRSCPLLNLWWGPKLC